MPAKKTTKIIFFGDVAGSFGRRGVKKIIPLWQGKYQPDIFVANVENLAHHKGVTIKTLEELRSAGIKAMTGGNHIWSKHDIGDLARDTDFALACPLNDSRTPKKYSFQSVPVGDQQLIFINLQGQTFMESDYTSNPFLAIDKLLPELPAEAMIIVDVHAEATSEKRALGFYLAGRIAAVIGTHTHVPTADSQILEGGTAYISDIGMTGPLDSILGIKKEVIIEKFLSSDRIRHELPESGQTEVNAVLLEIDNRSKKAVRIEHLREIID
ncbi:MAG: metallophosphoesterase [Parcubacteria group bacterium]|nr:MAG: metallophosphoesterase [Parcubacteria group bacterium]